MITGTPRFNALEVTSLRVDWPLRDARGRDVNHANHVNDGFEINATAAYLRQEVEGRPKNSATVSSDGPWSERTLEALYQLKRSMALDFAADQLESSSSGESSGERDSETEGIGEHLGALVNADSVDDAESI